MPPTNRHKHGFTLIEALVASVIMAAAVMTLCALSTRCLSRTKMNRQYELAWQLLDRQLTLIDHAGIDQFLQQGIMEGVFPETNPTYQWKVQVITPTIDNLYRVNIVVWWALQNRRYQITTATMLNGSTAAVDLEV